MRPLRDDEPIWFFAVSFAALAFLAGGWAVYDMGYRELTPLPPPPGTARCGFQATSALFRMFVESPLVAIASAIVAAGFGFLIDRHLCHRRRVRCPGEAGGPRAVR